MKPDQWNQRFKCFAIAIINLVRQFPRDSAYWTIGRQLIDAATSSAANYRAAKRAKSSRDFINKLKIVEEELDESMFWLELTVGVSEAWRATVAPLYKEANELLSITIASIKTARNKQSS
ncbi:MAG: four helix bundle protein [Saprospiraceae bacterium]|nr:four helix bundle protein [Saprospiraceae bacterium]